LINPYDLVDNSLLSNEQKKFIKTWFAAHPNETSCNALKNKNNELGEYAHLKGSFSVLFNKENKSYWVKYYGENKNKQLGTGNEGVAKLVQNMESNEWLAVKSRKKIKLINRNNYSANEEKIANLLGLNYQLIETSNSFFLVQALLFGEELFDIKRKKTALSTEQLLNLILALLHEVKKLHDNQIIHRDLKLENFIADLGTMNVRSFDFSYAITKKELMDQTDFAKKILGTFGYFHRDAVKNTSNPLYCEKTDIHAALVCIALICNCGSFIDNNTTPLLSTIKLNNNRCSEFVKNNIFPILQTYAPENPLSNLPSVDVLIRTFDKLKLDPTKPARCGINRKFGE
jgi:serine/threonine protein kinase